MTSKKVYYILGGILCLLAAAFIAVALTHPELSFPWPNYVSYTMYVLYGIYTVLIFCMPKLKGASLAACGIVAVQFIALSFLALSIGTRSTPDGSSWYLTIALGLTCAANFANLALQKRNAKK